MSPPCPTTHIRICQDSNHFHQHIASSFPHIFHRLPRCHARTALPAAYPFLHIRMLPTARQSKKRIATISKSSPSNFHLFIFLSAPYQFQCHIQIIENSCRSTTSLQQRINIKGIRCQLVKCIRSRIDHIIMFGFREALQL